MQSLALGLLVIAAILHASWNIIVKRAKERQIFTWWALVIGNCCFLPILLVRPSLPNEIWPYVVASAIAEGVYYLALARAYTIGDFSLVYPMARGAAPAFLATWAFLFLGERPSAGGLIGLGLLIFGLVVVGSGILWNMRGKVAVSASGIGAALSVALCISLYSIIDGAAVKIADPTAYTIITMILTSIIMAPLVLPRYSRQQIVGELRSNWLSIAAVGVLTLLTYILVMFAYRIAPVSYAGAIREISVIFGALAGWIWLGESFGKVRTLGSLLIFAGIVVIALFG